VKRQPHFYAVKMTVWFFGYKRFSKSGKRNRNESCLIVEKVDYENKYDFFG
jgi:hypothetical protein